MENILDLFTNTTYKTLKTLYDLQVTLADGTTYVPVSQAEIARIVNVSTITMNSIFKELKVNGLVYPYSERRGVYVLSKKAFKIIENMEKLDEGEG